MNEANDSRHARINADDVTSSDHTTYGQSDCQHEIWNAGVPLLEYGLESITPMDFELMTIEELSRLLDESDRTSIIEPSRSAVTVSVSRDVAEDGDVKKYLAEHEGNPNSLSTSLTLDSRGTPHGRWANLDPKPRLNYLEKFRVLSNSEVEIYVWCGTKVSWEPEALVQYYETRMLNAFWRRLGRVAPSRNPWLCKCRYDCVGRCAAAGLGMTHVYDIQGHKWAKEGMRFKVQWVGYAKRESTWVREAKLPESARELVRRYLFENGLEHQS